MKCTGKKKQFKANFGKYAMGRYTYIVFQQCCVKFYLGMFEF